MTLCDFISRLKNIQKDSHVSNTAQIHLGKSFNSADNPFEYFDIQIVGENIVLVPSDKWDKVRSDTLCR